LTLAYANQDRVDTRIVRIFNTFGPRMNPDDGRVVSNFIIQALKGEPLTIYGDGSQTRSFQYVHDLIDGLIQVMNSDFKMPINLGNPEEFTIAEFANMVKEKVKIDGKEVVIKHFPPVTDDPKRRKPDISRAKREIGWEPRFTVSQGVEETIEYFKLFLVGRI
jgi:UDP-glucuronate decarboxylase